MAAKPKDDMLSAEAIAKLDINPDAAREACNQAQARLSDLIAASAGYESRAGALFGVFISIALAAFGAIGALLTTKADSRMVVPLFLVGAAFTLGALFLALVFHARMSGYLGSDPEVWLHKDVLTGDAQTIGYNLAFVTRDYADRIRLSEKTNADKRRWVEWALWAGVAGTAIFIVSALISYAGELRTLL